MKRRCGGGGLRLRPVETATEALAVALIRNECRRWMTRNTRALDVGQQLEFFRNTRRRRPRHLLLVVERAETTLRPTRTRRMGDSAMEWVPAGYAVLRREGRQIWLTGGLAAPFRGRGLGRQIFTKLTQIVEIVKKEAWLEVRKSNRRALRLYRSLGFEEVPGSKFKVQKGVLVMRRVKSLKSF